MQTLKQFPRDWLLSLTTNKEIKQTKNQIPYFQPGFRYIQILKIVVCLFDMIEVCQNTSQLTI